MPALAALTPQSPETLPTLDTILGQMGDRLQAKGILAPLIPDRGIPGQIVAGIQRGAFGVGATFGDAIGVAFPDTGKGITDFFHSYQMQSSGKLIEQAAETATQSLGVLAITAGLITAAGGGGAVAGALGVVGRGALALGGLGGAGPTAALTAVATPAVFGLAQATQTRNLLQLVNDEAVKRGAPPLTSGEIAAAMAENGAYEFGGEFISQLFFLKRFVPGSAAFTGAMQEVRKYLVDPSVNRAVKMVAKATEESVRAGLREAPEEFAENAMEAWAQRRTLGPERMRIAQEAGLQVPGAPLEEGFQAAKVALVAGPFFAAGGAASSRLLRGRQQQPQTTPQEVPAGGNAAATTPVVPPAAPITPAAPGSLDATLSSLLATLQGQDVSSASARRTMSMIDQLVTTARPGEISPAVLARVPTPTAPAGGEAQVLPVGPGEALSTQELRDQLGTRAVPTQAEVAGIPPAAQPGAPPAQMSPDELLQRGSAAQAAIPYALPVGPEGTLTSEQIQAGLTGRPSGSLPTALEAGLQRQATAQAQQRYAGTPVIGVRPQPTTATEGAPGQPAAAMGAQVNLVDGQGNLVTNAPVAILGTETGPDGQQYVRFHNEATRQDAYWPAAQVEPVQDQQPLQTQAVPAPVVQPEAAFPTAAPSAPAPQDIQAQQALQNDLESALRALGFRGGELQQRVQQGMAQQPASIEEAIRLALGAPRAVEPPAAPRAEEAAVSPAVVPPSAPLGQASSVTIGMPVDVLLPNGRTLTGTVRNLSQDGQTVAVQRDDGQGLRTFSLVQVRPRAAVVPGGQQGAPAPVAVPQPAMGQQALVDTSQLTEGERATQAQIERQRAEAETGTRLRPTVEQAPPAGMFEQEQALPLETPPAVQGPQVAAQPPAPEPEPLAPSGVPVSLDQLAHGEAAALSSELGFQHGIYGAELESQMFETLRQQHGEAYVDDLRQRLEAAGYTGETPLLNLVDQLIDFDNGITGREATGAEVPAGEDILEVIRAEDSQGRRGIALPAATRETISKEFVDLVGIRQGGRGEVSGILNQNGMPLAEMVQDLIGKNYLPRDAGERELLDLLRERLRTGKRMGPTYGGGGLFEPSALLPGSTPGGERADATTATRRAAASIPARLLRIANGETIISTTFQAEPGRRVTIPGVVRKGGTIEVVRAIQPTEMIDELRTTGSVAFVGQTIRPGEAGSGDVAVLGAVVRDPQVEHLHYVFGDETRTVGLVYEVGSRLPGSAAPFLKKAGEPITPGAMAHWQQELVSIMRQGGYTWWRAVHNHPSGNTTASAADIAFTQRMARAVPGFDGHTIINHETFTHIDAAGTTSQGQMDTGRPDPFLQPSLGLPFTTIPIHDSQDAAAVGRALAHPGFVTLVLVNKRPTGTALGVRGVLLVPEQAMTAGFDQVKAHIESLQSEFGAPLAMTYYNGTTQAVNRAAEQLYRDGVLQEHVSVLPQGVEIGLAESVPELAPSPRLVQARRLEAAPGLRVQEPPGGVAEETPTLPTRQGAVRDLPNVIEGVTVAQVSKLATAYRMMFDVGSSLHSSHIRTPLAETTFRKLRITWPQMEAIGQATMQRWATHPEDLAAMKERFQRDPTAVMSNAERAAWVQLSTAMMDDLDVKRSLGEIDQATFDQEWDQLIKNDLLMPGASSAGRGLAMERQFQKVGAYSVADFLRSEEQKHGKLTEQEQRDKAQEFWNVLRTGDRDAIRAKMDQEGDPKLLDYYMEVYYGSLMSGFTTQIVNGLGTLAHIHFQNLVVGSTAVGVDWAVAGITGRERTRYMREIVAGFNGTMRNFGQAYKDAWYFWKSPFPEAVGGEGKQAPVPPGLALGASGRLTHTRLDSGAPAWERAPLQNADGTPNSWGLPMRRMAPFVGAASRLMSAVDVAAKTIDADSQIDKLATRQALQDFGPQAPQAQVDTFVQHVRANLSLYPDIEAEVQRLKQVDTFNDPPGILAKGIGLLQQAPQPLGLFLKLLVPFKGTPDRLLARGAELVPGLGLPVGLHEAGLTWRGFLPQLKAGDARATEVMAKQVVGVLLSAMAAILWDKDLLTGLLPNDPGERDAWQRQGKLPSAIKMGDNWVEYRRVEPFISIPFGALTSGLEAIREMKNTRQKQGLPLDASYWDDATAIAAASTQNMIKFVLDSSYFQGMAQFFSSISRGSEGFSSGLTQQLVSATLPLSGLLRNLNRTLEASGVTGTEPGVVTMRQRENVGQAYGRSIPGLAEATRPRLDVFGQPVVSEQPLLGPVGGLLSPIRRTVDTNDPVEQVFNRLQYFPQRQKQRQVESVVGRKLDAEEFTAYTERRGEMAREQLDRLVTLPFFENLAPDQQIARIKQIFSQATRRARREVFGQGESQAERRERFAEAAAQ